MVEVPKIASRNLQSDVNLDKLHNSTYDAASDYYKNICREIADDILSKSGVTHQISMKEINKLIKLKSSKYKLSSIPKYIDIIRFLPNDNYYKKLLRIKPVKTRSGIAVITVMPMPYDCPHGKCIYCPGGIELNTPLSYIGTEPSTKVAQKVNFNPFKQITSKITQLIESGHEVNKAEIVIVGGTFPFYPKNYQIDFVKKCYDALNSFNSFDKIKQSGDNNNNNDLPIAGYDMREVIINENRIQRLFEPAHDLQILRNSKRINETALVRCVGLTIETKPDYCKQEHIDLMLELGTTRIELGVQSLSDTVFKIINRGHTMEDVYSAFYLARNSGYKIGAHMMPGLPGSTYSQDIADTKRLFDDERLMPDMLKIYPTLVIKNTGLYKLFSQGKYQSYFIEDLVNLLVEVKKGIPPWVRIMRIQREIESADIVSGPKMGNIRQLVLNELKRQGVKCKCIRCREVGLIDYERTFTIDDIILFRREYFASSGKEVFLSFELKDQSIIFGFLRLRLMSDPIRKELGNNLKGSQNKSKKVLEESIRSTENYDSAIVRELHIYGPVAKIKEPINKGNAMLPSLLQNDINSVKGESFFNYNKTKPVFSNDMLEYQHKGLGRSLLNEAENICKKEYNLRYLSVISAVGTRDYYRKFGYTNNGPYVTKLL